MLEITVFDELIYICTREEARELWSEKPAERQRIWLEEEWRGLMAENEELRRIIAKKRKQPGWVCELGR